MADLSNVTNTAAPAIVRQAEDLVRADRLAKRLQEEQKGRRERAMRDAAAQRRTPGTSGR